MAEDIKAGMEGLQTMCNLARNVALLIRAFVDEKEENGYPEMERGVYASFPDGKERHIGFL